VSLARQQAGIYIHGDKVVGQATHGGLIPTHGGTGPPIHGDPNLDPVILGVTMPVWTRHAGDAAGSVPLNMDLTSTDINLAGARFQWEFAAGAAPATQADGSYTTPTQGTVTFIDGSSFAANDQTLPGFTTPSGQFTTHARILIDDDNGSITVSGNTYRGSAWSAPYTDTINVSVATWSPTPTSAKSQYLTLSNGNLTATMNNSVNANCGVIATLAVTGKKYFESTIVSHGTETNGTFVIGVTDSAVVVGPAAFPTPGSGVNGASFRIKSGSTAITVFRNGGNAVGTALNTAAADGDLFGISFDTTASPPTVKLSHKPGAGAWYDVQTLSLTSAVPANYVAYTAGFGRTGAGAPYDAWTTNFGALAFSRAFDAGYSMYG
jgi:hypothetical protein